MKNIQKIMIIMTLGILSAGNIHAGLFGCIKKSAKNMYYPSAQIARAVGEIALTNTVPALVDTYVQSNPQSGFLWRSLVYACNKIGSIASRFLISGLCGTCKTHRFVIPSREDQGLRSVCENIQTVGDCAIGGFTTSGIVPYLRSAPMSVRLACAPVIGYATSAIVTRIVARQEAAQNELEIQRLAQEEEREGLERFDQDLRPVGRAIGLLSREDVALVAKGDVFAA